MQESTRFNIRFSFQGEEYEACRSRTKNLPPQSHLTSWFLPLVLPVAPAPVKPSGIRWSDPWRSFGKSSSSGWLHSFFRILIALRGWDSAPRNRALISGEDMNRRYKDNWNSDNLQNTTCSYLTGTARIERFLGIVLTGEKERRKYDISIRGRSSYGW